MTAAAAFTLYGLPLTLLLLASLAVAGYIRLIRRQRAQLGEIPSRETFPRSNGIFWPGKRSARSQSSRHERAGS